MRGALWAHRAQSQPVRPRRPSTSYLFCPRASRSASLTACCGRGCRVVPDLPGAASSAYLVRCTGRPHVCRASHARTQWSCQAWHNRIHLCDTLCLAMCGFTLPLQARWLGPVLVSRARLPCRQRAGWCGAPPLNWQRQSADLRARRAGGVPGGAQPARGHPRVAGAPPRAGRRPLLRLRQQLHRADAGRRAGPGAGGRRRVPLPDGLPAPLQQARPRATRRPRRLGNRAPGAATPPLRCLQTIALSRKGCSVSELSRRRATDGRAAAGRSCTCTTRAFSSTARATAGWPSSTRTSSSCCATRARRTCPRCWPSTSSSARLLSTGRRAARALPRTCACAGPSVALLSAMVFGRPPTLTACRVSHRGSCTTQIARCQGAAVVLIACCTIGGGAVGPRNAAGWQHAGGVPALPARAQPGQPARQGHREPGICAARGR